jgi:inositol-1,3,4-trisphosphate 5/6-kinase/inositol-tetrakisphosphate 1-kinase
VVEKCEPCAWEEVKAQVDAAGLQLPLLAKSLLADGSSDSHKVAIIHDLEGLACVSRGDVPVGLLRGAGY